MASSRRVQLQIYAAITWLVLTCSLIVWWMYFAVGLVTQVPGHKPEHRFMLLTEGATLLLFLVAGGGTLIYFIRREQRSNTILSQFFAAFSHDIKTSLSSLRLQVEALREDWQMLSSQVQDVKARDSVEHTLSRLLSDTSRLQMQVENSLYLGAAEKQRLFLEEVSFKDTVSALRESWPQIVIELKNTGRVWADRRALDSIFNNLVHNAIVHGKAQSIAIQLSQSRPHEIEIEVSDNGQGFNGDRARLGQMHFRQNPSSGSGLGLFIVKSLLKEMKGSLTFQNSSTGFVVKIQLRGVLEK